MTAHTPAGTRAYTYTYTQPLYRPLLLHYPDRALSATLFAKTCSESCIQDLFPYSQGFHGEEVGGDWVHGTGNTCVECTAHAPSPEFSTSWRGVNSWQNTALGGALTSCLSLFSGSQAQGGWKRHLSTLGYSQCSLLTMVHVPKPVKFCKIHVGLHAPIFIWLERVGGSGAEETPV